MSSPEGSPQRQRCSSDPVPKCIPDTTRALLVDTTKLAEPGFPERVEPGEVRDPEEEVKSEDTVRTAEAGGGAPPSQHLTSVER